MSPLGPGGASLSTGRASAVDLERRRTQCPRSRCAHVQGVGTHRARSSLPESGPGEALRFRTVPDRLAPPGWYLCAMVVSAG